MKYLKILVVVIILAVIGYFLNTQLGKREPASDAEAMKQSLLAPANIKAQNLTPELKEKYLAILKTAQDELVKFNFDNLQTVDLIAQYKKLLGDIDGAITAWEYANLIRPQNSLSFSNLAALYHFDLKEFDKAEKNYLISIANDPDDINTIRNLYEMYTTATMDMARAEGLLLSAIEDNQSTPSKAVDLYALAGSFYAENGSNAKAIEYYRKVLEINPKNEAVKKEIARLEAEQK